MSSKAEKEHYDKLFQLGCIVCLNLGYGYSPPHIHHIRHGAGAGQKSHWSNAIPLCHLHHLNGNYGTALHKGIKAFESKFGTEIELLEQVTELLNRE